jgi:hypothetical protein
VGDPAAAVDATVGRDVNGAVRRPVEAAVRLAVTAANGRVVIAMTGLAVRNRAANRLVKLLVSRLRNRRSMNPGGRNVPRAPNVKSAPLARNDHQAIARVPTGPVRSVVSAGRVGNRPIANRVVTTGLRSAMRNQTVPPKADRNGDAPPRSMRMMTVSVMTCCPEAKLRLRLLSRLLRKNHQTAVRGDVAAVAADLAMKRTLSKQPSGRPRRSMTTKMMRTLKTSTTRTLAMSSEPVWKRGHHAADLAQTKADRRDVALATTAKAVPVALVQENAIVNRRHLWSR